MKKFLIVIAASLSLFLAGSFSYIYPATAPAAMDSY